MSEEIRSSRRARKARRRVIYISLLVLILAAALATRPLFRAFKTWRANSLAAQAETLVNEDKFGAAANLYRAALQLDPFGYRPLRGAASLASRFSRPEAFNLWQEVVKLPQATVGNRQDFAAAALQNGQISIAEKTLDRLLQEKPDTRTLLLASHFSERIGNTPRALEYARLAQQRAPADESAEARLAELLAASPRPEEQKEARDILWKVAGGNGAGKKSAIVALARAPQLSREERAKVRVALHAVTPFTTGDAIIDADLRLQDEPEKAAAIFDEIAAKYGGDRSACTQVAQWLNLRQQPQRVLDLVKMEDALGDDQLMLARLDALATLQSWEEIDTTLARKDLHFDPSIVESFRARSAQGRQSALDAEAHWNKALALAAGDSARLRFVASFAEQSGANEIALRAFDQLVRSAQYAEFALAGQQRLALKMRNAAAARTSAEKALALHSDDPNARNRVAYYNLLVGKDVNTSLATARELVAKYSNRLEFRVTAALGFLRQRDAASALGQFRGPPIEWTKTPPAWRAVYAAALLANENNAEAAEMVRMIPAGQLLPEEADLIGAPAAAVP